MDELDPLEEAELYTSLQIADRSSEWKGFRKCRCCGKPSHLGENGLERTYAENKANTDELFVKALELGVPLEVAAEYVSKNCVKEGKIREKLKQNDLTKLDVANAGYFWGEFTSHHTMHTRALKRLRNLPVELKRRVLDSAPKAMARMYELVDATKEVYHEGIKVGESKDNETRYKASKDILDRTLGKPGETLTIETEVRDYDEQKKKREALEGEFELFIEQKHGRKKTVLPPDPLLNDFKKASPPQNTTVEESPVGEITIETYAPAPASSQNP